MDPGRAQPGVDRTEGEGMTPRWTLRLGPPVSTQEPADPLPDGWIAHLTQRHADGTVESLCAITAPEKMWAGWLPGRDICQRCLVALTNRSQL